MKPPFPSYTQEWHNDTYDAINPTNPNLSLKGKKVIVTGGGAGIGQSMTKALALAGAVSIAILGRRSSKLEETREAVEKASNGVKVTTHVVDIVDTDAVKHAAAEIGGWDVLVSCAGYLPEMVPVVDAEVEEWWKGWEVNVKGSFNICHAFIPTRNENATLVAVNAGSAMIDVSRQVNGSSYNASKLGAMKFFEIVAAENPDVHVVNMHPGVVETDMFHKGTFKRVSVDTLELPAHFTVWLCSEEARFLRGRMVWCNWDVEELKAKRAEIEGSKVLTTTVQGWPFM